MSNDLDPKHTPPVAQPRPPVPAATARPAASPSKDDDKAGPAAPDLAPPDIGLAESLGRAISAPVRDTAATERTPPDDDTPPPA